MLQTAGAIQHVTSLLIANTAEVSIRDSDLIISESDTTTGHSFITNPILSKFHREAVGVILRVHIHETGVI